MSWVRQRCLNCKGQYNTILLYLVPCGDLNEKKIQKRGDICIYITDLLCCTAETQHCKATKREWICVYVLIATDSLCYTAETNTILQISCTPIKIKNKKNRILGGQEKKF